MDQKDILRKFIINKLVSSVRDIDSFIKEHNISSSYDEDDEMLKELSSYFFNIMCEDPNFRPSHIPTHMKEKYMNDPR